MCPDGGFHMQYSFLAGLYVLMGCSEMEWNNFPKDNFPKDFLVKEEIIKVHLSDLEQDF